LVPGRPSLKTTTATPSACKCWSTPLSSGTPATPRAALDQLAVEHPELVADDSALARLAHAHINPLGRYRFYNPDGPPPGQLRPLRDPVANDLPGRPTSSIGVSGDKH
jgi:hypothetical protein